MRRTGWFFLLILALMAARWTVHADVRSDVEAAARSIKWFEKSWVLYDRERTFGPADAAGSATTVQELLDGPATAQELLPLLQHDDPKVRTLAIAALAYRDYPKHLGAIAGLIEDDTQTFPAPAPISVPFGQTPKQWPEQKQTVGDLASAIISTHLQAAGHRSHPAKLREAWEQYWAGRADREHSLADLAIQWQRATQGTSPVQEGREDEMAAVLKRLAALPMPDRFLAAMKLRRETSSGQDRLPGEQTLLEMAKQLSREQRLALIRGQSLGIPETGFATDAASAFILDHARELLQPDDAAMLLEMEKQARSARNWRTPMGTASPRYAIAAAHLRPEKARSILREAMERFVDYNNEHRRELAVALFRLGSEADLPYLTHVFYSMVPSPGTHGGGREAMLHACQAIDDAKYQRLVHTIVWDLRLSSLGPPTVRRMLQDVGRWTNQALLSEEEIRQSMGADESMRDGPYPWMNEWRDRLRRSMSDLERVNPELLKLEWELPFETGL